MWGRTWNDQGGHKMNNSGYGQSTMEKLYKQNDPALFELTLTSMQ